MQKWIFLSSITLLLAGCSAASTDKNTEAIVAKQGSWRMEMQLKPDVVLPFEFDLMKEDNNWKVVIYNGEEKIVANETRWAGDSFYVQLPVFESEFKLLLTSGDEFSGSWFNYYKGADYEIPVRATADSGTRFSNLSDGFMTDFGGRYHAVFSKGTADEYDAIGLFEQDGDKIVGTFATETGDYRHLAGNINGNKMMLSTFDGSHAFLFEAEMMDSSLVGRFYSGTHFEEPWVAEKDEEFQLKNPTELTYLKEGYDRFYFEFPDLNGKMVSLDDEQFKDKVVIVQIMGSWCPNCLDETSFLTELYSKYKAQGLEVVALAFERTRTPEQAVKNIERLQQKTGANYHFLLGGSTRADKAAEKLPMLNHVMSYPTALFIDKQGEVRTIHTGFYGPSTGEYYTQFVEETEQLVQQLLAE